MDSEAPDCCKVKWDVPSWSNVLYFWHGILPSCSSWLFTIYFVYHVNVYGSSTMKFYMGPEPFPRWLNVTVKLVCSISMILKVQLADIFFWDRKMDIRMTFQQPCTGVKLIVHSLRYCGLHLLILRAISLQWTTFNRNGISFVQEMVTVSVDGSVLDRIAKIMSYLRLGSSGKVLKKKKKDREAKGNFCELERSLRALSHFCILRLFCFGFCGKCCNFYASKFCKCHFVGVLNFLQHIFSLFSSFFI